MGQRKEKERNGVEWKVMAVTGKVQSCSIVLTFLLGWLSSPVISSFFTQKPVLRSERMTFVHFDSSAIQQKCLI